MNNRLISLKDLDVSDSVDADLFISFLSLSNRSKKIPAIQSKKTYSHWCISSATSEEKNKNLEINTPHLVSCDQFKYQFHNWLQERKESPSTIYIDISCMPHRIMAIAVEEIIIHSEKNNQEVELICGYVIAEFSPPPLNLPPNEDIKPISSFFAGWPNNASATTALIIGLGYEHEKAEGACEYFDASDTWAFTPKSPIEKYDDEVFNNNRSLLDRLNRKQRILCYSVCEPSNTFGELAGLILETSKQFNIVILPFGPKIFYMLSLIAAVVYREIGVWDVIGEPSEPELNQDSSLHLTGFITKFGPNTESSTR